VILLAGSTAALMGCGSGKFFVPTCQETNSCSSGGGGGSTTYSSFAYVANASIGTLILIPLPKTTFTSLSGSSYTLGAMPSAIAATPKGTFLYVATLQGSVVVYTIGSNGALTLGNDGSAVASTLNPIWMTVDPSGNWLFLISSSISTLFEYQINTSTGALSQVGTGTPLNSGTPTQVYVTPNDQNVYVALSGGGVNTFSFNSTSGALSNEGHLSPRAGGDNALTADNNSAFLFVGEAGSGIRVFTIGANASLSEIPGSPFASQLGPKSIVVDPTNSYVYVANSTANVITGYSLGSTGTLTPLPSSPFATGSSPTAMSLDPTGTYLLLINSGGGPDLQVFSFDATTGGKLDSVTSGSTGTDPAGAISLSVVP
jgi:6-phosphogluconolactonase